MKTCFNEQTDSVNNLTCPTHWLIIQSQRTREARIRTHTTNGADKPVISSKIMHTTCHERMHQKLWPRRNAPKLNDQKRYLWKFRNTWLSINSVTYRSLYSRVHPIEAIIFECCVCLTQNRWTLHCRPNDATQRHQTKIEWIVLIKIRTACFPSSVRPSGETTWEPKMRSLNCVSDI